MFPSRGGARSEFDGERTIVDTEEEDESPHGSDDERKIEEVGDKPWEALELDEAEEEELGELSS